MGDFLSSLDAHPSDCSLLHPNDNRCIKKMGGVLIFTFCRVRYLKIKQVCTLAKFPNYVPYGYCPVGFNYLPYRLIFFSQCV